MCIQLTIAIFRCDIYDTVRYFGERTNIIIIKSLFSAVSYHGRGLENEQAGLTRWQPTWGRKPERAGPSPL